MESVITWQNYGNYGKFSYHILIKPSYGFLYANVKKESVNSNVFFASS